MVKLASSDTLEISLRKLSSAMSFKRTKDRDGAKHMLATRPPGSGVDVAPNWMLEDASTYGKAEHQQKERRKVHGKATPQPGGGGGGDDYLPSPRKPKGNGKDKPRGGGAGGAAQGAGTQG